MIWNRYRTLDDIQAIVTDSIPEGVNLEYKGSNILIARDIKTLCKTVTALANSAGGQFVIGIKSQNGTPIELDGGVPAPSRLDWIYKIINTHTFPAVECVEVLELLDTQGSYYVVSVASSVQAPHQSEDRRYYKRQGSHSEPMEHYEIEDVRNRPKRALAPLRIELFTQDQLAFLYLKNDHPSDSLKNVRCRIDTNFKLERDGITSLDQRGLREFRPQAERYFILDSVPMMLQEVAEPELHVHFSYEFHEAVVRDSVSFFPADLTNSAIVRSPTVMAIKELTKKIDNLSQHLERLRHDTEKLTQIADGSGLRLSHRTLRALNNTAQLYDPREFDCDGYMIVLDITSDEAYSLYSVFGTIGSSESKRKLYYELSSELRAKFEQSFRVDFD